MRLAYLCNRYPATSHTFIRREIAALESCGFEITRISIRPSENALIHPADHDEADRTIVLLEQPLRIAMSVVRMCLSRPRRFFKALKLAARSARRTPQGLKHFAYLAEACRLHSICRDKRIHHIHAHMGTNPADVAHLCAQLGGPKYSLTLHGPEEWATPEALDIARKVESATFTACISEHGADELRRITKPDIHHSIAVVRCGVDDAFLNRTPSPLPEAQELLSIGRLVPRKEHMRLIDAFAGVLEVFPRARLTIAGDGPMRETLEKRIDELGLNPSIELAGWLDEEEVIHRLERSRALVIPSAAEGLPVVIMEAMALRRPVIATAVAGVPELVEDGLHGWLVQPGDTAQLAKSMTACLAAEPSELAKMGESAHERVRERHDAATCARNLGSLFQNASGRPASVKHLRK